MTEDEKRQQKAMLLLEYQEAEQHLAHLEAKAASTSRRLAVVSEWLANASKRHNDLRDQFYSSQSGGEVSVQDPQVQIAMDFATSTARRLRMSKACQSKRSFRVRQCGKGS
jgi:hypothetical protein